MSVEAQVEQSPVSSLREITQTMMILFKGRIVMLLVLSALAGAFLGQHEIPSWKTLLAIIVTGVLSAGGSSAINQYLERNSDVLMHRTKHRPMANGTIRHPLVVLSIAVMMIAVAVLGTFPFNPPMAFYLLLGAVIYVGVYTIWLKPRSITNIVIGGAAGSCAVMTGGAAVGGASDPGVISLALLLFLWTPAHFWALALFYKDDYAASSTPMLPVLIPEKQSAWWIFIHAAGTGFAALMLAVQPALGWLYLVPVGGITLLMLAGGVRLIRNPERKNAIRLFVVTNIFLLAVFLVIIIVTAGHQLFFT